MPASTESAPLCSLPFHVHLAFFIIMPLSGRPCVSQRPAGWMVPEAGRWFCDSCWAPRTSELAMDILIATIALTRKGVCSVSCKSPGQRNGGAVCEHTKSGPLAPPQSSFSLRLITKKEEAGMPWPDCHTKMHTWG